MSSHPSEPIPEDKSLTWPKRALKACATCRRDKIRCDGGKPCTSCAKKGYTAEDCTDGCEPCRRARVRCEDGKPCRRCQDMKLECCDSISAPARQPATQPAVPRITQRGERAKLACSSCRRDNKKCDDQRPCSRCIARREECIHVGRGPKLVQLRCEACRDANKRCEDSRPCRYCIEDSKECVSVARKGKGHGNRVKVACTNCRRDKIRCNGDRPCASCFKKRVECVERVERACQACSREGTTAECPHQRSEYAGKEGVPYSTSTPIVSAVRGEAIDFKPNALQIIQSTYGQINYPQERPQWSPYIPEHTFDPINPVDPRTMSEPQYLYPQVSSQYTHVPFTMVHPMQTRSSDSNVYQSYRHYHTFDYNNHPQSMTPNLGPLR